MLGIITNLNDMLQVHGKLSIEAKQRILRSFGEFSKLVGNTITNIAPQVSCFKPDHTRSSCSRS